MNEAHLHLVVNHFPIIGTILGLGILVVGLLLKNNSVKNTAFFLFIVAAIFAAVSMATGEGAEELVEDMANIGHISFMNTKKWQKNWLLHCMFWD